MSEVGIRRTVMFWTLAGTGLALILSIAGTILWLVMPGWFRDFLIDHSPSLHLAYAAAEHSGIEGTHLAGELHLRFPLEDLLVVTADRLERGTPEQQAYAARHIGWLLYPQRKPRPHAVLDNPALNQRLIDGLFSMSRSASPQAVDTACFALLALGERKHLPDLLLLLDRQPNERHHSLMALGLIVDDPLVTTHLLAWYQAKPDHPHLRVLLKQDDPRVEELALNVLRSPSYPSYIRVLAMSPIRRFTPAFIAALRSLCGETDSDLRSSALATLSTAPDATTWMLDIRLDASATPAHHWTEKFLSDHANELTPEQRQRWLNAPALSDDHSE